MQMQEFKHTLTRMRLLSPHDSVNIPRNFSVTDEPQGFPCEYKPLVRLERVLWPLVLPGAWVQHLDGILGRRRCKSYQALV